jgi:sugar lactone lactonase YvrE
MAGAEQLRSISQLESYTGRLYLLDEQQNQIWRYSPAGLGYDEAPTTWFDPQVQANLAGVVATAIDGDIWMLNEDGVVLRYRQGGQLPFSLDNSAGLTGRMVDMTIGADADDNVYLADGSQDRILVFDKQGNYLEQFQAAENNALRGLRGLYLDNVTGTLFILTQKSLYAHSLPR